MSNTDTESVTNHGDERTKKMSFLKSIRKNKLYRRKCLITLCCALAYGMYGWQIAQIGTALPELQQNLQVDLDTISWMFTCFNIGTIVSGFFFGFLYDRLNRFTLMAFCLVSAAILHAICPLVTSFPVTLVLRLCVGVFLGGAETGMISIVSTIWDTDGAAGFLHATYLSFFIGGFIGPLVTYPFMLGDFLDAHYEINERSIKQNNTSNGINLNNKTSVISNLSETTSAHQMATVDGSRIFHSFLITGIVTLMAAIPFMYMFKSKRYRHIADSDTLKSEKKSEKAVDTTKLDELKETKCESLKQTNVKTNSNGIKKTGEIILEIKKDSLSQVSNNANCNDIEMLPTQGISNECCDISFSKNETHHKHVHESKIAIIGEPQTNLNKNKLSLHNCSGNTTTTEQESKYSENNNLHITTHAAVDRDDSEKSDVKESNKKTIRLLGNFKLYIIILIDILVFFMYGGDDSIYNFLPTFCLDHLNWSVVSSSTLLSVFNIVAVVGGIIGIFLARVLTPTKLMITALIGWNLTFISGYVSSAYHVDWLIWTSVSLSGPFIVLVPASAISWLQKNVCSITGKVSASITLAGGIGMASTPNIIGFTMQTITPLFYWYIQIGFAFLGFIVFVSAVLLQISHFPRKI